MITGSKIHKRFCDIEVFCELANLRIIALELVAKGKINESLKVLEEVNNIQALLQKREKLPAMFRKREKLF